MPLLVDDVLGLADLLALDSTLLSSFGADPAEVEANLTTKRRLAVDTWLRGVLEREGLSPLRHQVRRAPSRVWGYTGGVYTDLTAGASDGNADTIDLQAVLAHPAADALFVQSPTPFVGVWLTLLGATNTNTVTASWAYWTGAAWTPCGSVADGPTVPGSTAFSGGGRVSWTAPTDWQRRPLGQDTVSEWGYYARLTISSTLSGPVPVTHLLPVRVSRLTQPAALYALSLLYQESWGAQSGEWRDKAAAFRAEAERQVGMALAGGLDEFTAASADELTPARGSSTARPPSWMFTWDRG